MTNRSNTRIASLTPTKANSPAAQPGVGFKTPVKACLQKATNRLMRQFVNDMRVAGLSAGTQEVYMHAAQRLVLTSWLSPAAITEEQLQAYLIGLRQRDVARETFRTNRFGLQFLFQNTLGRDWPLFKKN